MDVLRRLWGEAVQAAWLWLLGSLLFFALTAAMGLRGTFSEKAGAERGRAAGAETVPSGKRKPGSGAASVSTQTAGGGH
jgi:hypothetical protein